MRILVVDDEEDLRSAIVQTLVEEGFAVDEAGDGESAIFKATAWEYDAVVLDLMLPNKSGWEVLGELRQSKSTPVLILSAKDTVPDRVRGLNDGADDYLVKPFSLEELVSRLRALIRRAAGHSQSTIDLGRVTVDLNRQSVTRDGTPVTLTAREYALLEMLALHRGKLVSRTMIYDHIFGEDDDTLSNLVDVHISHIRKKLGADLIETRRGQGYLIHG